jgi:hypothetical protein
MIFMLGECDENTPVPFGFLTGSRKLVDGAHSTDDGVAIMKEKILSIKRQTEACTYLLNNGVLPLLYGMIGAAVFLSRQYIWLGTELWALNA